MPPVGRRHVRNVAGVLVTALVVGMGAAGMPTTPAHAQQEEQGGAGVPKRYVHPEGRFLMSLPPGAEVFERKGRVELALRSPKGYAVNVQLAPTNRLVDLDGMLDRLEEQFYGADKMWTAKLGRRGLTVGGLPAREAFYRGTQNQARVVVARGLQSDFVLMFLADPERFGKVLPEFNWILGSFRAAPAERGMAQGGQAPAGPTPTTDSSLPAMPEPSAPMPAPTAQAAEQMPAKTPAPMAKPTEKAALPADLQPSETYVDRPYGFAINHPPGWDVSKPAPYTVVMSGETGSQAFYVTVGVQNVQPAGAKTDVEVVSLVVEDLKRQLQTAGAEISQDQPYFYAAAGRRLAGRQFVTVYDRDGRKFVQWTVVLPRPKGTVGHILTYSAPEEHFDSLRPTAQAMLRSFRVLESGPTEDITGHK